ncbi:MAG: hypothetical protein WBO58_01600, partial [Gammaproteobacteria bacterium]
TLGFFSTWLAPSGNKLPGNLLYRLADIADCLLKTDEGIWFYANQSEPGEARAAGSSSGGGGNAPFSMR